METIDFIQEKTKSANWRITIKVVVIGFLILFLLIPKVMIMELIGEREKTALSVKDEVMQQWSMLNTVRGPVLTIPYIEKVFDNDKKVYSEEIRQSHFLPKLLKVEGELFPEQRHRSIYDVMVYESKVAISGYFVAPDFEALKIDPELLLWDKAELSVGINDLRGISELAELNWNDRKFMFSPGIENSVLGKDGITIKLPADIANAFPGEFACNFTLKGAESLEFAPLGEVTEVKMKSAWNDPGFVGNFLPENSEITQEGFTANWKVLHFNRNFPQAWKDNSYSVTDSDFGVKLVTVADHYQKNMRSAKYGILVILFTFLSFFLNEIITKQRIHPFQYILVGISILIFYLLLLSVSEQIGFNFGYLISAVSVILMVLLYSRTFLKKWSNSFILTLILATSFGFIFILLQLESFALLAGSIGLFAVLALIMFFTRKINWYNM
ncbi:MAG: cell envelope integrity protein CreD [Draconibacterium sp.]|nr:cell envelope integrity protein CreD [Draconibacterium sp.]